MNGELRVPFCCWDEQKAAYEISLVKITDQGPLLDVLISGRSRLGICNT
jgi:hypothetical protein